MRKKLLTGILLLASVATASSIAIANNVSSIFPDNSIIEQKTHLKKIKELMNGDNKESLHQYLSTMSTKDILETAAEFAEEGHLKTSGIVIAPYFNKGLGQAHVPQIKQILMDKNRNDVFRAFVLDGLTHSETVKGYDQPEIIDAMLTIANDSGESDYLRRFVLLNLRTPKSYKKQNSTSSELVEIFNDKKNSGMIKGSALTAMRRSQDPNFHLYVEDVLNNSDGYSNETVRYAVIEAAKSKTKPTDYTRSLNKIVRETQDKDVYGSTIFALGIIGGPDAVKGITENYGRFEDGLSCASALKRNYKTIIDMLNLNQPKEDIKLAIKAAKSVGLTPALGSLENIVATCQDKSMVLEARDAIQYIKANPASDNYHKWEVE